MKIKDQLKIYIFPKFLIILNKLGLSWERIGSFTFFSKSTMLAQAEKLGQFDINKNKNKQNIFVLTMLSGSTFHLYIEALLALGLKKKGHEITFIIDDNTLPISELKKNGEEDKWNSRTETDFIYASKFLDRLQLKFIPISKFIMDAKEITYNEKYNYILEASLFKHYKVGVISEDLPFLQKKTEYLKKAIAITNYVGEKLVKIKPNLVIMNHGIYSTWGPPFQVLENNKIPILIHSSAKKRFTQIFNWNKTGNSWDVTEEWEKVKDQDLTKEQLKEINTYLDSRILHKEDVFVYNFGKETTKEETIRFLGLDPNKPIYTLFTNVLWDAASAQREIVFKNPVDWVIETIAWFNEHPEKQLIVKIHPAEIVIGTKMPFYDIIISRITPKNNIRIIQPKEKINSWSIYEISDLGLVHTTTVGMEMPLVYKPCMVVSQTHYRNKGFTIDVNSKERYYDVLNNFDYSTVDFKKNKIEALKYSYLLFIRYQVPFDMFIEFVPQDVRGFKYVDINDYMKSDFFYKIIKNIEIRKPIFSN